VEGFLTVGVSAALRQLLEFGLFHGDPHPGNVFAMRDGRIAYVDFGNVSVLSQVWNLFCLAAAEFTFPFALDWIFVVACLSIMHGVLPMIV
jgi:Ser/Thr protein kinase RdoA (MazF antagonist)